MLAFLNVFFLLNLPQDSWTRILRCRQKRIARRIARLRAIRPVPVSPPTLLFQDAMDSATQLDEVARDEQSLLERLEQSQSTPSRLAVEDIYSQSDDDQEEGEPQEVGSDSDSSDDGSIGYVPPSGRASVVNAEMMDAEEAVVNEFPPRTQILDEPSRVSIPASLTRAPSGSAVEPGSQEWLRAAAAIEIPDLLKWTAAHSSS